MTSITLHLFGKPEWEFPDSKITPDIIESKGNELKEKLHEVSEAVKKLASNKWECNLGGYDLFLTKDISKNEAEDELNKLGIRKDIYEMDDDYEEETEE